MLYDFSEKEIRDIITESILNMLKEGDDKKKVIKIHKNNGGNATPMVGDPMMGAAPQQGMDMGGMNAPQGGDPSLDAAPQGEEDALSPEEAPTSDNPKIQELIDIANGLGDKGLDTLLAYARSLKDNMSGDNPNREGGGEAMPPMDTNAGMDSNIPMQECVTFTKKQLKKINEGIGNGEFEQGCSIDVPHTTRVVKDRKSHPCDPPKNR